MSSRPDIKPGDWIRIGNTLCVVSLVRSPADGFGDCEVVHNSDEPVFEDARWDGERWRFLVPGAGATYTKGVSRLDRFVAILKRGI